MSDSPQLAIITGASAGIGSATAQLFVDSGYQVVNLSRRPCAVAGVESIPCDLANNEAIECAMAILQPRVSAASSVCLVHNACQMRKDNSRQCDSESLREVLETNVVAANSLNQQLIGAMPEGSSILYIGSTLAEKAVAGAFSYVISKHAVVGMMRATCQDLMGSGIHTACICPGFTDTEMLRGHLDHNQEIIDSLTSITSFKRLIDPAEIAELIHWAHHNPVINGAVLHANLGQKEN